MVNLYGDVTRNGFPISITKSLKKFVEKSHRQYKMLVVLDNVQIEAYITKSFLIVCVCFFKCYLRNCIYLKSFFNHFK
jgi:hypothetical protein